MARSLTWFPSPVEAKVDLILRRTTHSAQLQQVQLPTSRGAPPGPHLHLHCVPLTGKNIFCFLARVKESRVSSGEWRVGSARRAGARQGTNFETEGELRADNNYDYACRTAGPPRLTPRLQLANNCVLTRPCRFSRTPSFRSLGDDSQQRRADLSARPSRCRTRPLTSGSSPAPVSVAGPGHLRPELTASQSGSRSQSAAPSCFENLPQPEERQNARRKD